MRIIRTLPIITAIVLATLNINAKNLLRIPDAEVATIGIYIEDLKTGEVIASQNVNKVMTPASVTKSITSADLKSSVSLNSSNIITNQPPNKCNSL